MELLIIWILTIIASVAMELSSELRIFKDVADNGYKIDVKRISELANQINPNASKVTLMSLLIPIVNIMGVLQRTMIYNNARNMIIDQLSVLDSLIPMTKEEEEEYKKNPSTMNALFLNIKSQVENEPTSISYTDGEENNTIWFRKENERYIIIKSEGPISKLSVFEQRAKLEEKLNEEKLKTITSPLDLKENDDIPNELSTEDKIQELKDLKGSILNKDAEANKEKQPTSLQKIIKKHDNNKNS